MNNENFKKLRTLWNENFPELTLSQLTNKLENYYHSNPIDWSDDKLILLLDCYIKDLNRRKEPTPAQIANQDAVFDLPFEPMKATAIEIGFENMESILVPITDISKFIVTNDNTMTIYENNDYQQHFEYEHKMHRAQSVAITFKEDKSYTSYFTLVKPEDGETKLLSEFLNRNDISDIRCVYQPKHFSYSLYPLWEGEDYTNNLQHYEKHKEEIILYIGEIVKEMRKS